MTLKVIKAQPLRQGLHGASAELVKSVTTQLETIRDQVMTIEDRVEEIDVRLARMEREARALSFRVIPGERDA